MTTATCSEMRLLLSAVLDGVASAEQSRAVEEHLRDCPACRKEKAALQEVVRALRSTPRSRVPAGLHAKILTRAANAGAPRPAAWPREIWLRTAATFLVLAALVIVAKRLDLIRPEPREEPEPARAGKVLAGREEESRPAEAEAQPPAAPTVIYAVPGPSGSYRLEQGGPFPGAAGENAPGPPGVAQSTPGETRVQVAVDEKRQREGRGEANEVSEGIVGGERDEEGTSRLEAARPKKGEAEKKDASAEFALAPPAPSAKEGDAGRVSAAARREEEIGRGVASRDDSPKSGADLRTPPGTGPAPPRGYTIPLATVLYARDGTAEGYYERIPKGLEAVGRIEGAFETRPGPGTVLCEPRRLGGFGSDENPVPLGFSTSGRLEPPGMTRAPSGFTVPLLDSGEPELLSGGALEAVVVLDRKGRLILRSVARGSVPGWLGRYLDSFGWYPARCAGEPAAIQLRLILRIGPPPEETVIPSPNAATGGWAPVPGGPSPARESGAGPRPPDR